MATFVTISTRTLPAKLVSSNPISTPPADNRVDQNGNLEMYIAPSGSFEFMFVEGARFNVEELPEGCTSLEHADQIRDGSELPPAPIFDPFGSENA